MSHPVASVSQYHLRAAGDRIYIETLGVPYATEEYASWLEDPEVHMYLETRSATVEELRAYIAEKDASPDALLCGIFLNDDDTHIGTIKLEPIDWELPAVAG